jgi:four helix bundle protein
MKAELQKRLVLFSSQVISSEKFLKSGFASRHLYEQIIRSATSAALNYGEAQTAESRKDFIHKLGIVVKELKETEVNLEVLIESGLFSGEFQHASTLKECKELIAIFIATIKTARSRDNA